MNPEEYSSTESTNQAITKDNASKRNHVLRLTLITFLVCIIFFGFVVWIVWSESSGPSATSANENTLLMSGALICSLLVSALVFIGASVVKIARRQAEKTQTMTWANTKDIKPLLFTIFLWIVFASSLYLSGSFFQSSGIKGLCLSPAGIVSMLSMLSSLSTLILRSKKIMRNQLSKKKVLLTVSMVVFVPSVVLFFFLIFILLGMQGG